MDQLVTTVDESYPQLLLGQMDHRAVVLVDIFNSFDMDQGALRQTVKPFAKRKDGKESGGLEMIKFQ